MNPEKSAKAVEAFNKALNGDLDAGVEYVRFKHHKETAQPHIVEEFGRALGKDIKTLSDREKRIVEKKTNEFLQGRVTAQKFRTDFVQLGASMGRRM